MYSSERGIRSSHFIPDKTDVCFSYTKRSPYELVSSEVIPVGLFAAGHQPAADHFLEQFEIFGSMVQSASA